MALCDLMLCGVMWSEALFNEAGMLNRLKLVHLRDAESKGVETVAILAATHFHASVHHLNLKIIIYF